MDSLIPRLKFSAGDTAGFGFHPDKSFEISTISVQISDDGTTGFHQKTLKSEDEYKEWIKRCQPLSAGSSCQPALLLVVHKRLDGYPGRRSSSRSTALPYSKESFQQFSSALLQHRSLAWLLLRSSTAVFKKVPVKWGSSEGSNSNPSMVYHCRSDTASLQDGNDVVLSATCFDDKPLTIAVMYGCTPDNIDEIEKCLKDCKTSAFHPLALPLIFAEIERSRFFDAIDSSSTALEGRILELERRVRRENTEGPIQEVVEPQANPTMNDRDLDAIHLSRSMNSLKNGMESLVSELRSMRDHLKESPGMMGNPGLNDTRRDGQLPQVGLHIHDKLEAIIAELQSKIRTCDGLLDSLKQATQMEWNYYTRRQTQVGYSVATATRVGGSQMRRASLVQMIFLPPTFFATFFSMISSWSPQNGSRVIWSHLSLYGGLTMLLTSAILWLHRGWLAGGEMDRARVTFQHELERDADSSIFSAFSLSRSSPAPRTEDVELGLMPR